MMADTAHPLQEIALRCGFPDPSGFSRAFRRRFGQAPRIALTPDMLPNGLAGTPYHQTMSASGGKAPYTYAAVAGEWPPDFSLSASGELEGNPAYPPGAGPPLPPLPRLRPPRPPRPARRFAP